MLKTARSVLFVLTEEKGDGLDGGEHQSALERAMTDEAKALRLPWMVTV